MPWDWKERYNSYTELWDPIRYGIWAIYVNAKEALFNGNYSTLFSFSKLQELGHHTWFTTLNEHFVRFETNNTAVPKLVSSASGVVLELGPGLGNQLCHYDKNKVTRIVGVESNLHSAPDIEAQIHEQSLEDIYELVIGGVQESDLLERHGVVAESLDTVLSIQVLCSVPDPYATAKELYRLLKPGGKLIFWEHCQSSDWLTATVQSFCNISWHPLIGCNLNRDVRQVILAAGRWENLESLAGDEKPWSVMPRVWGELVKPTEAD